MFRVVGAFKLYQTGSLQALCAATPSSFREEGMKSSTDPWSIHASQEEGADGLMAICRGFATDIPGADPVQTYKEAGVIPICSTSVSGRRIYTQFHHVDRGSPPRLCLTNHGWCTRSACADCVRDISRYAVIVLTCQSRLTRQGNYTDAYNVNSGRDLGFVGKIGGSVINSFGDTTLAPPGANAFPVYPNSAGLGLSPTSYKDTPNTSTASRFCPKFSDEVCHTNRKGPTLRLTGSIARVSAVIMVTIAA